MEFSEVNVTGDSVQVKFRVETLHGDYQDALYFKKAEYDLLSPEDIEAMKLGRVNNWVNIIENPPTPVEPIEDNPELPIVEG
jgi:hypothetical protein